MDVEEVQTVRNERGVRFLVGSAPQFGLPTISLTTRLARERIAFADCNDWEIAVAIGERGRETWRYSVDSDAVVVLQF